MKAMKKNPGKQRSLKKYLIICFTFGIVSLIACSVTVATMFSHNSRMENIGCKTTERVFDYGELLNSEEEEYLRQKIAELSPKSRTDFIIYTDDEDLSDNETIEKLHNFMDENRFGWEKPNGDSVLLYLNMVTRYVYADTYGRATDVIGHDSSIYNKLVEIVGKDNAAVF